MTISDIQDGVSKAASFFVPPFLQLAGILILVTWLTGFRLSDSFVSNLQKFAGDPDSVSFRLLRELELLKLMPLIVFFLFLLLLVLLRNVIRSLAQILPPQVVKYSLLMFARHANPVCILALWNEYPDSSVEEVFRIAQDAVEDPPAGSREADDAAYWRERAARLMRTFDSFKVLAYAALACGVWQMVTGTHPFQTAVRMTLAIVILAVAALISNLMSLNSTYQEAAIMIRAWGGAKGSLPAGEFSTTQERSDSVVSYTKALCQTRWWGFWFVKTQSLHHYLDILRGR